jgi:hypothetical protein
MVAVGGIVSVGGLELPGLLEHETSRNKATIRIRTGRLLTLIYYSFKGGKSITMWLSVRTGQNP